jgi:hypothetical protein
MNIPYVYINPNVTHNPFPYKHHSSQQYSQPLINSQQMNNHFLGQIQPTGQPSL